ncbi:MAG: hypothetical protein FWG52_09780 [Proteobacteria bacterium]|jgi:hypothetical protein|nr:hypothetical protein [Pseudomonadota bacterium]
MTEAHKFRREFSRWIILLALNNARPVGTSDRNILAVVRAEFGDFTIAELRREIDYLKDRKLIEVRLPIIPSEPWHCSLTRCGVDIVEYTVECGPGIARPQKYW